MQIPQTFDETTLGLECEVEGALWRIIRIVDQVSLSPKGVQLHEQFIQLTNTKGRVMFHSYKSQELVQ